MAGGAGWGDPLERDPELVRRDVREEKLSRAHAEREYGVVLDPTATVVDRIGTQRRRDIIRARRQDSPA
jgi:N-methylhydantoinase B